MRTCLVWILIAVIFVIGSPAPPSLAQGGWYAEIVEACNYHGCNPDYVYGVMMCESGGDPNAVSSEVNRETGTHDLGLFQINVVYWGEMGPVEQIWFAAEHLTKGDVWWECQ